MHDSGKQTKSEGAGKPGVSEDGAQKIFSRPAGSADIFEHYEDQVSEYADYNRSGRYVEDGTRVLPARYYSAELNEDIYYRGRALSKVSFLEGAVLRGVLVLNERLSPADNVDAAFRILVQDRARPLYPWSTALYSEDTLYHFPQDEGRIGGPVRAFYVEPGGQWVTVRTIARQLASGIHPAQVQDEHSFLRGLDEELWIKACMLGKAARLFRERDEAYSAGILDEKQFLQQAHLCLMYFLGRDEGRRSVRQLRSVLEDPDFADKALRGMIRVSAPSSAYRRPVLLSSEEFAALGDSWIDAVPIRTDQADASWPDHTVPAVRKDGSVTAEF